MKDTTSDILCLLFKIFKVPYIDPNTNVIINPIYDGTTNYAKNAIAPSPPIIGSLPDPLPTSSKKGDFYILEVAGVIILYKHNGITWIEQGRFSIGGGGGGAEVYLLEDNVTNTPPIIGAAPTLAPPSANQDDTLILKITLVGLLIFYKYDAGVWIEEIRIDLLEKVRDLIGLPSTGFPSPVPPTPTAYLTLPTTLINGYSVKVEFSTGYIEWLYNKITATWSFQGRNFLTGGSLVGSP